MSSNVSLCEELKGLIERVEKGLEDLNKLERDVRGTTSACNKTKIAGILAAALGACAGIAAALCSFLNLNPVPHLAACPVAYFGGILTNVSVQHILDTRNRDFRSIFNTIRQEMQKVGTELQKIVQYYNNQNSEETASDIGGRSLAISEERLKVYKAISEMAQAEYCSFGSGLLTETTPPVGMAGSGRESDLIQDIEGAKKEVERILHILRTFKECVENKLA